MIKNQTASNQKKRATTSIKQGLAGNYVSVRSAHSVILKKLLMWEVNAPNPPLYDQSASSFHSLVSDCQSDYLSARRIPRIPRRHIAWGIGGISLTAASQILGGGAAAFDFAHTY